MAERMQDALVLDVDSKDNGMRGWASDPLALTQQGKTNGMLTHPAEGGIAED